MLDQSCASARRGWVVETRHLTPVDDKHILVKQQYLEEIKALLQEEVSVLSFR